MSKKNEIASSPESQVNKKKGEDAAKALVVNPNIIKTKVTWEVSSFKDYNFQPNLAAEALGNRIDFSTIAGDKDVIGTISDIYHYAEEFKAKL